MRLSRFTDIGLRALMYIAAQGRNVSAREVADAYGVSRDHVTKSMQGLVALGALSSTPGRNGGFALDADPSTLRLGDLVRSLEPSLAIAECFGEDSTCPLTDDCALASALFQAREAFFVSLDRYTLADLVSGTYQGLVQIAPRELEVARA
ncbi:MAG: Rrf2 family transcriptional regulator [Gemmatimonadota bacterium]|nr:Rrf2 family transcriptional regulator [Gemmatimonadota bacterium]